MFETLRKITFRAALCGLAAVAATPGFAAPAAGVPAATESTMELARAYRPSHGGVRPPHVARPPHGVRPPHVAGPPHGVRPPLHGYRHHHHHHYRPSGAAIGAGIAGGIIAGAALSEAARADGYSRCAAEFRSFNPETGTYVGYDGAVHVCPYLR